MTANGSHSMSKTLEELKAEMDAATEAAWVAEKAARVLIGMQN